MLAKATKALPPGWRAETDTATGAVVGYVNDETREHRQVDERPESALDVELSRLERVLAEQEKELAEQDDSLRAVPIHSWVAEQRAERSSAWARKLTTVHVRVAANAQKMVGHLTRKMETVANPMWWILAPAQAALRKVLVVCRISASLISWDDAVQTSLVYAALVLTALLLAAFASSLALLLRIALHLAGAYLLGPHHWYVRRRRERAAAEWEAKVARYEAAAPESAERDTIISAEIMKLKAHNKKMRRARERAAQRDRRRMSEEAYLRSLLQRRLLRDARFQVKHECIARSTLPHTR